ncbi:MAG: hypothetical protein SGPRY_012396 [Prymnesium sp.]
MAAPINGPPPGDPAAQGAAKSSSHTRLNARISFEIDEEGVNAKLELHTPRTYRRVTWAPLNRLPVRKSGTHYSWVGGVNGQRSDRDTIRTRLLPSQCQRSDSTAANVAQAAMCAKVFLPMCVVSGIGTGLLIVLLHSVSSLIPADWAIALLISNFVASGISSLVAASFATLWHAPSTPPRISLFRKRRQQQERSLLWMPGGLLIVLAIFILRCYAPHPLTPQLNDVSTDTDDPPSFISPYFMPSPNASFPPANARIISVEYPNLAPHSTSLLPAAAFDRSVDVCGRLGWTIHRRVRISASYFKLQASWRSAILTKDITDIVIRVRGVSAQLSSIRGDALPGGSVIDGIFLFFHDELWEGDAVVLPQHHDVTPVDTDTPTATAVPVATATPTATAVPVAAPVAAPEPTAVGPPALVVNADAAPMAKSMGLTPSAVSDAVHVATTGAHSFDVHLANEATAKASYTSAPVLPLPSTNLSIRGSAQMNSTSVEASDASSHEPSPSPRP